MADAAGGTQGLLGVKENPESSQHQAEGEDVASPGPDLGPPPYPDSPGVYSDLKFGTRDSAKLGYAGHWYPLNNGCMNNGLSKKLGGPCNKQVVKTAGIFVQPIQGKI